LKSVLVERLEDALRSADAGGQANGTAEPPAVDTGAEEQAAVTAAGIAADADAAPASDAGGAAPAAKLSTVTAGRLSSQELVKSLTVEDRMKLRASRFGVVAGSGASIGALGKVDLAEEIQKRKERAKKFGMPTPVFAAEEELKKKQRAERFNLPPSKEEQAKIAAEKRAALAKEIEEKKQQRAERFGLNAEEEKAAERAKRFASDGKAGAGPAAKKPALMDDKMKARAERFGMLTK